MNRHTILTILVAATSLPAQKFYADDPVQVYPAPQNVETVRPRRINEYYDFFQNLMAKPGEIQAKTGVALPARAVNTLGEAPDSEWYTNRHGRNRMTIEELQRGPGNATPPSITKVWRVTSAKAEGITPGFTIVDGEGRKYLLKFDPPSNPELASAADVISSKFLYALGYNVPENYIVRFRPEQLSIDPKTTFVDHYGKRRPLTQRDLTSILANVRPDENGEIRALASRFIPGTPIGAFRYHGTRADDPNDTIPHEHRRDLRGLRVFAAWLGHDDSKALNTLDTLVQENGVKFVKHYLIDFGASLGSASYGPNSPRSGNEYLFDWSEASRQFVSLGLWVPRWAKAKYPHLPSVGAFEYTVFDPAAWVPEYPNSAFLNMDAEDAFWAAKQVMAFTEDDIRAIVRTGEYSDPAATEWVVKCLLERRNKIGRTFLRNVLPLDRFAVRNGNLTFADLRALHFNEPLQMKVRWHTFDNNSGEMREIEGATTFAVPASTSEYVVAEIASGGQMIRVYVRNGREIVGRENVQPEPRLLTRR
ncbi:MAG TPA: hypothetical protein VER03_15055 [Bryobacteraceae bacterium]|nr:hypothetical protein [Bryobacteraceae bacterium]